MSVLSRFKITYEMARISGADDVRSSNPKVSSLQRQGGSRRSWNHKVGKVDKGNTLPGEARKLSSHHDGRQAGLELIMAVRTKTIVKESNRKLGKKSGATHGTKLGEKLFS
jgi:hypothetical protein